MASKSKKRRRVLGASCILAALIIAGSSFAWFTSKDEVTNRLTASADYNVSIIENFAPPKQWVPGQTVTKEEAVVNTGNVDAFVHQTVSGVMTVTVEVPSTVAPTADNGYIELDKTEAGTLEAGSYLAYAPAGVTAGNKVISVIPNTTGSAKLTDFNPSVTGLYIFRRAIVVDGDPAADTKYEYVGYYYIADGTDGTEGTYYKLNNIIKDTLVLKEDGTGDLASAPDVTYAKETKQTLNKVPMTFEAATTGTGAHGDRLVISYDKNANPATTNLNQQTFEAYRDYLDSLQGKTTWNKGSSDTDSKQVSNTTGLIDHDDYAQTADGNIPADNYSNYSSKRLESRKTETEVDVKAASPQTAGEVDWVTVYNNAKADRKTINEGVKAAEALRALRTTVEGLIGISADETAPGLYQSRADYTDKFHYKATAESMSPADTNAVVLKTPTANTGDTLTSATYDEGDGTEETAQLHQMTADTMDQERFAHYDSDGVKWNVVTKPYAANTTGLLQSTWDAYENAVKERKLIEAKIAICDAVAGTASTTSVARITLADNTYVEVGEYKAWLEENLATAQQAEAAAKAAYDAQQKIVKDDIEQLNKYQDKVNAANEVDYDTSTSAVQTSVTVSGTAYSAVYKGDKSTAASYPSETDADHSGYKSVVNTVTNEGQTDSLDEDVLEAYLKAVYGIALKDTSAESQADYWNGTTHMAQATYSPTVTKDTIDGNLTSTAGVIGWKDNADITGVAVLDTDQKDAVDDSLYYEDQKVGFMKTYRDGITAEKKAAYDAKVKAENLDAANSAGGNVKIYVNLANLGDGTAKEKWQYIPEAAAEAGKYFDFYYTSILPSGQTSALLIESLEFDESVKQDAFRDIQLDLNVAAESAQVVYNGDVIEATAANATITGAKTTADTYATVDGPVKWEADSTAKTAINDKDPNPKADADVTPATSNP